MPQQRATRTWFRRAGVLALLAGLAVVLAPGRSLAQEAPPAVPSEEEPEVLTSGPVNEAFAAPVVVEDQGGVIAPSAPPEPVEEQPTSERPVGGQYAWIPGYWSWGQQRQAWVWVSGCWRAVPPGQSWVPVYWTHVSSGWEWVAGFWTPAGTQELEYLSTPPPAFEVQATSAAPGDDYTWVPGCYYWRSDRWVPRHGYWLRQVDGWCWTPSYLLRTPRGYVFCGGHWDYSLHRRGVLYAPVYMSRGIWSRRGFRLALSINIGLDDWDNDLFVCPGSSHYYFGDY